MSAKKMVLAAGFLARFLAVSVGAATAGTFVAVISGSRLLLVAATVVIALPSHPWRWCWVFVLALILTLLQVGPHRLCYPHPLFW